MPAKNLISNKRLMINKANARIVAYVSVAAFILVFSLVATKTLVGQAAYQNRVISKKRAAVNQLKADISATDTLKVSYKAFTDTAQNVLGGNPHGVTPQDGNNAKIVLDALPSTYDFPGLTTSLEALVAHVGAGVKIDSISGTDDEVAQSANQTSVSPKPVPIPFTVVVEGDYGAVQNVIKTFESSIRPIQMQKMDITGTKDKLTLNISAQTYYQPSKSLSIKKEVVK
jgi:Tfp pilus assembly protein PilO